MIEEPTLILFLLSCFMFPAGPCSAYPVITLSPIAGRMGASARSPRLCLSVETSRVGVEELDI